VITVIHRVHGHFVGADIVELNPTRDIQHVTAMAAAKLLKELLAIMAPQVRKDSARFPPRPAR
jgi:arginase family enzyme